MQWKHSCRPVREEQWQTPGRYQGLDTCAGRHRPVLPSCLPRSSDLANTIWALAVLKYQPSVGWWDAFERQVSAAASYLAARVSASRFAARVPCLRIIRAGVPARHRLQRQRVGKPPVVARRARPSPRLGAGALAGSRARFILQLQPKRIAPARVVLRQARLLVSRLDSCRPPGISVCMRLNRLLLGALSFLVWIAACSTHAAPRQ